MSLAPQAKVVHLSWGVDLSFFPSLKYDRRWSWHAVKLFVISKLWRLLLLSTLAIRVINTELPGGVQWPPNVRLFTGGREGSWETVSYKDLLYEHYAGCSAALIILQKDPQERFAAGFTQLLEAMALAWPVIVTRTGALASEIDVEKEGCGLFVPPNDAVALANAMRRIADDPARAEAMGLAGRRLCETRYNIVRYADGLHQFFASI